MIKETTLVLGPEETMSGGFPSVSHIREGLLKVLLLYKDLFHRGLLNVGIFC